MGFCAGCEYLTSRHNCKKYNKRLAYQKFSGGGLSFSTHERCSECDKDYLIKDLFDRHKQVLDVVKDRLAISNNLLPDEDDDQKPHDDEEVFDQGRGQGMYEVCVDIKAIIEDLEVYFAD